MFQPGKSRVGKYFPIGSVTDIHGNVHKGLMLIRGVEKIKIDGEEREKFLLTLAHRPIRSFNVII